MNSENILGINVANGISILIMGAFGALILAFIRKAVTGGKMGATSSGARAPGT